MDIIIIFFTGFVVGYIYFGIRLRSKILQLVNEHGLDLEDKEPEKIPVYKTEIYNDLILLYDINSNFTTQGHSLEELAINLNDHKKVKIAQVNHEQKMLLFVDGQVKNNNLIFVPKIND